ncbi:hypothetical protein SELMODRAFT_412654 [Selaginella moellendorffii]|uniref:U2A'/phosphoprotein 32 family A C-terminal domain-containing protein n=1 Tax=Selaginella moellendorffii TaxID=88036 RepID=D8RM69_SELML|nr:leucine-rich repeat protein SHOC-2 [Selaginella moellendorffii]EFJ27054.1 hypothetical protein SELMODRAFT_412654 [Selaginella moellendorffii]|eukprot:XP_002972137.1 leucine-rich repeat protein SHOC-2 [Selaginella moellendorffii]
MVILDGKLISGIGDAPALGELALARRKIDEISDELHSCGNLTRIDLSGNLLTSVEALAPLKKLKWLSLSGNKLTSLKGLEGLKNLSVLNCSKNELTSTEMLAKLRELRALILNDNQITSIGAFDELVNLDTLVLSQNPISSLGTSLTRLTSLKKLSLSHCEIKDLGSSISNCLLLEELRLAHNHLKKLPKELGLNSRLRIIDVGHNSIKTFKCVKVLKQLQSLANLSLRGNPLCDEANYPDDVKSLVPDLQVFDGRPTDNKQRTKHRNKPKQTTEQRAIRQQKETVAASVKDDSRDELTEAKPFIELVASSADAVSAAAKDNTEKPREKKRKDAPKQDSKVVSIIEGGGRETRKKPKKPKAELTAPSSLANALEAPDIGGGGVSSWDS